MGFDGMLGLVAIEVINTIFLAVLVWFYVQNYRQMKTSFGLGLILFAVFLLAQVLMSLYFHSSMLPLCPQMIDVTLLLGIIQAAALAILVWVTVKSGD